MISATASNTKRKKCGAHGSRQRRDYLYGMSGTTVCGEIRMGRN